MKEIAGPIMIAFTKMTKRIENNEQKKIAISREWNLNAFRGEKHIRLITESFDFCRWRLVATFLGSKMVVFPATRPFLSYQRPKQFRTVPW